VKEKDYILSGDLTTVCTAQDILRNSFVKNSPHVEESEWETVDKLLSLWSGKMVDEVYPLDTP